MLKIKNIVIIIIINSIKVLGDISEKMKEKDKEMEKIRKLSGKNRDLALG